VPHDPPGFVKVRDKKTVLIPDRRGNNRLDTLRNIARDPRISLLFIIPGIGNTLRINGRAVFTEILLLLWWIDEERARRDGSAGGQGVGKRGAIRKVRKTGLKPVGITVG
jgi:hypothetical protein